MPIEGHGLSFIKTSSIYIILQELRPENIKLCVRLQFAKSESISCSS